MIFNENQSFQGQTAASYRHMYESINGIMGKAPVPIESNMEAYLNSKKKTKLLSTGNEIDGLFRILS